MNTYQIIDRAHKLVVDHIRGQITEPINIGKLSGMVKEELSNDDGFWIKKAMDEQP
jgi:hypothetical protein